MRSSRTLPPVVLVALLLTACGGASQTDAQREQELEAYAESFGADVDVSTRPDGTQSVAIDRRVGGVDMQAGTNLELPDGFPDDVPLYPQMNIVASGTLPTGVFTVQGMSDDAPERLAEFYGTELAGAGWTESASQRSPAMRSVQYQKGDRTTSINLVANGTGTMIQLMAPRR